MTVEITHEKTGETITAKGVSTLCRCGWLSEWMVSSAKAQEAYDEHIASLETHELTRVSHDQNGWVATCSCTWVTRRAWRKNDALSAISQHINEKTGSQHALRYHGGPEEMRSGNCPCGWHSGSVYTFEDVRNRYAKHLGKPSDEPAMDLKSIELMVSLMQQNHRDYAATTQALLDSRQARIYELEANLHVIKAGVDSLFADGVMPTEKAILRAVRAPDRDVIDAHIVRLAREATEGKA